jgi:hypothetical protein
VIACEGRTIVLDAFDARSPLRVYAGAGHRGPQAGQWAETVSEHPLGPVADRPSRAAAAFITAARARDVSAGNAGELAHAALAWETARESIARGGEMLDVPREQAAAERPALQLIRGGGRGGAGASPELTVVRGRVAAGPTRIA